jgi:hypothetical protein
MRPISGGRHRDPGPSVSGSLTVTGSIGTTDTAELRGPILPTIYSKPPVSTIPGQSQASDDSLYRQNRGGLWNVAVLEGSASGNELSVEDTAELID